MSSPYPLHLLSHGADTKVLFFIVVEVFRPERVRFESQTQKIQAKSQRVALLRGRTETQRTEMHRTGSRVRTNEKQYELQTFPPFWKG